MLLVLKYEKELVRRVSFVYLRIFALLRVFGLMFVFFVVLAQKQGICFLVPSRGNLAYDV